jgi:four helix bundle protein
MKHPNLEGIVAVRYLQFLTEGASMIGSFRDLVVWQKGMDLAVLVYKASDHLPRAERFALTSQIRRAVVSIPSNVAEGKAVGGQTYPRHVKIALGSEAELQTQLELAKRLKMLGEREADDLIAQTSDVGRMLTALLNALAKT